MINEPVITCMEVLLSLGQTAMINVGVNNAVFDASEKMPDLNTGYRLRT